MMTRNPLAVAILVGLIPLSSLAEDFRGSVEVDSGGTLEVELDAGSIEIDTQDEDEVEVEARASGSFRFELTSDGTNARLTGRGGSWLGIFPTTNVSVRIKIPERFSIELHTGGGRIEIDDVSGDVNARTSGGRIEIDGAVGQVEVETSGGRIQIDDVDGDLFARTSGGPVEVSDVTGDVEVRTSGGHIKVHDVGGSVVAKTSGGRISVRFNGLPQGDLETSGGSIEVEVPEDAGIDLDARTSGGRVTVDSEVTVRGTFDHSKIEGKINGGGSVLRLRTSGGNVRLRTR